MTQSQFSNSLLVNECRIINGMAVINCDEWLLISTSIAIFCAIKYRSTEVKCVDQLVVVKITHQLWCWCQPNLIFKSVISCLHILSIDTFMLSKINHRHNHQFECYCTLEMICLCRWCVALHWPQIMRMWISYDGIALSQIESHFATFKSANWCWCCWLRCWTFKTTHYLMNEQTFSNFTDHIHIVS